MRESCSLKTAIMKKKSLSNWKSRYITKLCSTLLVNDRWLYFLFYKLFFCSPTIVTLPFALSGCGVFKEDKFPTIQVVSQRSVLKGRLGIETNSPFGHFSSSTTASIQNIPGQHTCALISIHLLYVTYLFLFCNMFSKQGMNMLHKRNELIYVSLETDAKESRYVPSIFKRRKCC